MDQNTKAQTLLSDIKISYGKHASREEGLCLLEATALVAGEPHSDKPSCVDPLLAAFARRLNDSSWRSNEARSAALLPFVPLLVGTSGKVDQEKLRWFFSDQAVRNFLPAVLEVEGLQDKAKTLRDLPVTDSQTWLETKESLKSLETSLEEGRSKAVHDAVGSALLATYLAIDYPTGKELRTPDYVAEAAVDVLEAAAGSHPHLLDLAVGALRQACSQPYVSH